VTKPYDDGSGEVFNKGFSRLFHSKLAGDAVALSVAHALGLVVPFVTIPYLARVLRPEGFGLLLFAQSFGLWLVLVIEFGFDLSGTRIVSRIREDPTRLAEVVLGVQSAKILALLLTIPLAVIAFIAVPLFRENPAYLLWGFLFAGARGLSPNWYFFGQERMIAPAFLEAGGKVIAAVGVFLLVKIPEDGWRVLALQALGMSAAVAYMTRWMYREVSWEPPSLRAGFHMLKKSAGIFVFRGSSGLYMQANAFVLGLITNPAVVGLFGGAERIIRAGISLLQPLSQAFFPRVSHSAVKDLEEAGRLLGLSLVWIGGLSLIMGVTSFLAAPILVNILLGPGYESAVPILQALSVLVPIIGVGTVFGIQWALPLGFELPFSALVVLAGSMNLVLAFLLVPQFGGMGMALSVVTAEALVASGLIVLFHRKGGSLWPLRVAPTESEHEHR
jgi:PST family polysaccharide transporter